MEGERGGEDKLRFGCGFGEGIGERVIEEKECE